MRKFVVAAVLAAGCAALAAAAWGSSNGATRTAVPAGAANALVKCGKTRTIAIAAPLTGDAASLGLQQLRWAKFFVARYNRHHRKKFRLVQGDTQLPNTAQALAVAHQFASNSKILGLVGPAGSQEVQDTVTVYRRGALAAVTGSATRVALTRGKPGKPRETPVGYFFRTVPNDDQQGARVASYISGVLKARRIYIIDDQEAYSQGLADQVQKLLSGRSGFRVSRDHVSQSVSDFSSLITRIPSNTQIVYIPWQLAPKAQLFFTQLRAAGKSAIVFGSDGTFAPGTFNAGTSQGPGDMASPADFAIFHIEAGGKYVRVG